MGTRIRGENVQVKIIKGGKEVLLPERAVVSFEYEPQQEITSHGFLGETTERKDEVYKGTTGRLTLQFSDPSVNEFIRDLNDRARRSIPAFKVNILITEQYPDGKVDRLLFPDVKFGAAAKNYASREAYGQITLPFAVDDYIRLGS
jgi:hypothetical protein